MAANGLAAFVAPLGRAGTAEAADGRALVAAAFPLDGLEEEPATGTGVAALPCLTRDGRGPEALESTLTSALDLGLGTAPAGVMIDARFGAGNDVGGRENDIETRCFPLPRI